MVNLRNKKINYLITKDNQLSVKIPSDKIHRILKGRFEVDKNNNLVYLVDRGEKWHRVYNLPHKIEFKGRWELSRGHNLALRLIEEKKKLVLKGNIITQEGDWFVFQIKSKLSAERIRFYLLKLKGVWYADKFNRIIFQVKRRTKPDLLIFRGIWKVNSNHQVIYEYKKLKTKQKQVLVFKGFWSISSRNRISYILDNTKQGCFNFRAHLESTSIYPESRRIKYRIGVGMREKRRERILTLYGIWKIHRKLGPFF